MFGKLVISAAFMLLAGAASAEDLQRWGGSEFWDVMIDPALHNSCLIQPKSKTAGLVRIGLDRVGGGGYVTVFNSSWGDVKDGATFSVSFKLDGTAYDGQARAVHLNGVPGARIAFDNVDVFMGIAQHKKMTVSNSKGVEIAKISLNGAKAGLNAVVSCQSEQG